MTSTITLTTLMTLSVGVLLLIIFGYADLNMIQETCILYPSEYKDVEEGLQCPPTPIEASACNSSRDYPWPQVLISKQPALVIARKHL